MTSKAPPSVSPAALARIDGRNHLLLQILRPRSGAASRPRAPALRSNDTARVAGNATPPMAET